MEKTAAFCYAFVRGVRGLDGICVCIIDMIVSEVAGKAAEKKARKNFDRNLNKNCRAFFSIRAKQSWKKKNRAERARKGFGAQQAAAAAAAKKMCTSGDLVLSPLSFGIRAESKLSVDATSAGRLPWKKANLGLD